MKNRLSIRRFFYITIAGKALAPVKQLINSNDETACLPRALQLISSDKPD
jgi:hypothetical protein